MALDSFKSVETDRKLTALNVMTGARAVGGLALGIGMARYNMDPTEVLAAAAVLAATDAEGSLLKRTARFPRLQKALRIMPSKIGRIIDPIADKIYTTSVFVGGMVSGAIPIEQGVGILAAEAITVGATSIATSRGEIPEVPVVGKMGMMARCGAIVLNLAAAAETGSFHDTLQTAGLASAIGATVLGAMSAWKIYSSHPQPEQPGA